MRDWITRNTQDRPLLLTSLVMFIAAAIVIAGLVRLDARQPVEALTSDWVASGHADFTARSFNHWNDDDPPLIPANCATCHSTLGLLDYVGERGTEAGSVAHPVPIGTTITCVACHNEGVHQMQRVAFPSGVEADARGDEAACLICHQGTDSTVGVNAAISGLDDDAVDDSLGFMDAHYHVAAATLMGGITMGGYQYADRDYVGRFEHTQDFQTCASCHDAHRLDVDPLVCSTCHVYVQSHDDLRTIRKDPADYDGDGDTRKGIALEIDAFHDRLHDAIRLYAEEVIGTPIYYTSARFPYFFVDTSGDGQPDPAALNFGSRYTQWTPRLVRAAYNYQFVQKDPGAYAHNPRYSLQLLYDSLADMNESIAVGMEGLSRP